MKSVIIVVAALILSACGIDDRVTSTQQGLCQLDPRTGRCKVSEDTLATRARDAAADYAAVSRDGMVCGNPGGDDGVWQCDKAMNGGVLDCHVIFDDSGLVEEVGCYFCATCSM
jgi:hypothetical protein